MLRVFQKESSEGLEVPQVQPCSDIYLLLHLDAAVQNPLYWGKWPKVLCGCLCNCGKPCLPKTLFFTGSHLHHLSPLLKPLRSIKRQGCLFGGHGQLDDASCLSAPHGTEHLLALLFCVKTWNPRKLASIFASWSAITVSQQACPLPLVWLVVLINHFDSWELHMAHNSSLFIWWLFFFIYFLLFYLFFLLVGG